MRPNRDTSRPTEPRNASENRAFVEFLNIEKTYDGKTLVVNNLNFSIREREFLSLLGPSGSGKTTSLLMLAGFEHPTNGEIFFEGKALSRIAPHRRQFGMVFQDYALFPHMSVFENVAFPLSVRRVSKPDIQHRVMESLAMVELGSFAARRTNEMSGGQQQRVALARALVYHPRIVLMDEPLGALDKQLREQMQLEIKHIQKRLGITVVYVTHDQQEALSMSDRIAVFSAGRIHQIDSPAVLYEAPSNSFVAQFVGENNRLLGRVAAIEGNICRVALSGGELINARRIHPTMIGEATLVSVRPERVVLNPGELNFSNCLFARVEELIYQGDALRIRLTISGEPSNFMVKVPAGSLRGSVAPGESVTVAWDEGNCLALDAP